MGDNTASLRGYKRTHHSRMVSNSGCLCARVCVRVCACACGACGACCVLSVRCEDNGEDIAGGIHLDSMLPMVLCKLRRNPPFKAAGKDSCQLIAAICRSTESNTQADSSSETLELPPMQIVSRPVISFNCLS